LLANYIEKNENMIMGKEDEQNKSHGLLYGVYSLYYTEKSTTQNNTILQRQCISNWVPRRMSGGYEKLKWVTAEEFYWLSEICKYELNF